MQGLGKIIFSNKRIYEGEFKDSRINGYEYYIFQMDKFEGESKDGLEGY